MPSIIHKAVIRKPTWFGIPYSWIMLCVFFFTPMNSIFGTKIGLFTFILLLIAGKFLAQYFDLDFADIIISKIKYTTHFKESKLYHEHPYILPKMNLWGKIKSKFLNNYFDLESSSFEKLSILCLLDNSTTLHKNNTITKIVRVEGVDYSGMNPLFYKNLYEIRKSVFLKSENYMVSSYTLRFRQKYRIKSGKYSNRFLQKTMNFWSNSFDHIFVTNHYLAISTKYNPLNKVFDQTKELKKLNEFVSQLESSLSEYSVKLLEKEELMGFWASLINGEYIPKTVINKENFEHWIFKNPIEFKQWKPEFYYLENQKVASFFSIKNFSDDAIQELFDSILKLNIELIMTQHFSLEEKEKTMSHIKDILRKKSTQKYSDLSIEELENLLNLLDAEQTSMASLRQSFQIISNSKEEHKENIQIFKKLLENNQYLLSEEVFMKEPLYFSQFPAQHKENVRVNYFTIENICDFISFSTSEIGINTCSFGNEPVQSFVTEQGNLFNFTFHVDKKKFSVGHTLVIGNTGSGKTVLISFLLASAMRYSNMKILGFDSLYGLNVFTKILKGKYIDFSDNQASQINPFQFKNIEEHQIFLYDFLCELSNANEEEKMIISKSLSEIITWEKDSLYLEEIILKIADENTELFRKLEQWKEGEVYGGFFSSKKTNFSFNNTLTIFELAELLNSDNPRLLGLVASYITHCFYSNADGNPRIVFIDEMASYLRSPLFKKIILKLLEQVRKLNGILVSALQNLEQLKELGDIESAKSIASFYGKYILFPEKSLNEELYKEVLGLNENELFFLKTTDINDRKVLIKTKGGGSTIIHIDLEYLGDYFKVFSSSDTESVKKLRKLEKQYPNSFEEHFLKI